MNKKSNPRGKSLCVVLWLIFGCVLVMGPVPQKNILVDDLVCNISATFAAGALIAYNGTVGVLFDPGSDIDTFIVSVGVTGAPKWWWDESENRFAMNKNLQAPEIVQGIEIPFSNTDDGSSGSGITIPASANILDIHLLATTDFTSGGTPSIDIGFTGDKNELVAGIDIDTQTNILLPPPVATIDKWAACTGGDIFVTCTTCTGGAGTIRITYTIN